MALVVLLRGINVGGRRTFRPTRLAAALGNLDVVNIGATGTLVVRGRVSRARLRAEVARRLPFEAVVVICDGREILELMARDRFAKHPAAPDVVRFVSVLARLPRRSPSLPIQVPPRGPWLVRVLAREGRFVVGLYRRRMKVIGYLSALDRMFGVPATTRGWSTIAAIARVLEAGSPRRRLPRARPPA